MFLKDRFSYFIVTGYLSTVLFTSYIISKNDKKVNTRVTTPPLTTYIVPFRERDGKYY